MLKVTPKGFKLGTKLYVATKPESVVVFGKELAKLPKGQSRRLRQECRVHGNNNLAGAKRAA